VNDRGPFGEGKIIDLSRGAAEQLGVLGGPAAVRVRRVNPPEQERAALRAHGRAAERLETPAPLLAVLRKRMGMSSVAPAKPAPKGKPAKVKAVQPVAPAATRRDDGFIVEQAGRRPSPVQPAPVASRSGGYVVQVAAFGSKDRAQALARQIGGSAVEGSGGIWRVRFGPYPSEQAAQAGVRAAAAKGYADARIMNAD
jgi:rare lipoprotein A